MRVAIANFSPPQPRRGNFDAYWANFIKPSPPASHCHLFDYPVGWGFHIFSLGMYLHDQGIADEVEFWDFAAERSCAFDAFGILRFQFYNFADLKAYLARHGTPDLFINHGWDGIGILRWLDGKCFRVHVPALRPRFAGQANFGADCYLVDDERFLDAHSMLYIPVVNTEKLVPHHGSEMRDFVYIASVRANKRHDILLNAVRNTLLTGHLHPVNAGELNLKQTHVTTSALDERDVLELLETSRIAVYPGDKTSAPAAMWECVAADLPIVVNKNIVGGNHVVVPGVTGELAAPKDFRKTMQTVLERRDSYRPRAYFLEHWATIPTLDSYLNFFRKMGWSA